VEALIERCCGLDVHQATVVACLLIGIAGQKPQKEVRTFGTMQDDLKQLCQWLLQQGCTHVAMESTGVYWMPVYEALEGHFQLVVGNAQHIKNVPGRKTDVKDSEWIADLLRHGLIAKSFVPPEAIRELRDLTRYRRKLTEAQAAERNRLQRLLETADVKLASVASDVLGVSGRLMLRALIEGQSTPAQMAELARGMLRRKLPDLERALCGRLTDNDRFLLKMQLDRVEQIEADISKLDERIEQQLKPYQEQHERLMQIPGVDRVTAAVMLAELGADMNVFPTAQHAAAWAGLAPGNNESAGKRKGGKSRKGNAHLKTALVQAAVAASRKKGSYLKAKYWKVKARRGAKRAAMTVAHKILVVGYHMLLHGTDYAELGESYQDDKALSRTRRSLVRQLEGLGFQVTLNKKQQLAA
jgi:transposase